MYLFLILTLSSLAPMEGPSHLSEHGFSRLATDLAFNFGLLPKELKERIIDFTQMAPAQLYPLDHYSSRYALSLYGRTNRRCHSFSYWPLVEGALQKSCAVGKLKRTILDFNPAIIFLKLEQKALHNDLLRFMAGTNFAQLMAIACTIQLEYVHKMACHGEIPEPGALVNPHTTGLSIKLAKGKKLIQGLYEARRQLIKGMRIDALTQLQRSVAPMTVVEFYSKFGRDSLEELYGQLSKTAVDKYFHGIPCKECI